MHLFLSITTLFLTIIEILSFFANWQAVPRYIPGAFLLVGKMPQSPRTADKPQSHANAFYQFTFSFLNPPHIDE